MKRKFVCSYLIGKGAKFNAKNPGNIDYQNVNPLNWPYTNLPERQGRLENALAIASVKARPHRSTFGNTNVSCYAISHFHQKINMVTGKKRKDYNDFEEEMLYIAGHVSEKYGLDFYFEHIHQTFEIAEKTILKNAEEYKKWFDSEDYETRSSVYFNDPQYEINITPLTTTLYNSHFITIHSEFEIIWKEIIKTHNKYFPRRQKFKINFEDISALRVDSNCVLDKTLFNYKILASYNYIRNKLVHGFRQTSSSEYQTVKHQVENSLIKYITIKEEDDKAYFQTNNISFCRQYANKIIGFISTIADTSFADRTHSS